jgi:SAM-dependent methyltransferase
MKKVSGEFLSKLLWTLQQCNLAERTPEEIKQLLLASLDVRNLYVDMPDDAPASLDVQRFVPRLVSFDEGNLERLNALLPWSSFVTLGKRRVVGAPWSATKRHAATIYPDRLIEQLNRLVPLAGMSVLELGCFEGHQSLNLARHGAEVWAIDGRIENVIKTLVRVWLAGQERKVTVQLLDLERTTMREQLAALGRSEPFDLVHHRGVLYHLSDPVANLVQCGEITRKHLYLHTQIAAPAQADTELRHATGSYEVFRYREASSEYAPFAGITPYAHWLTRASLERLLTNIGFPKIKVLAELEERNGLRLELIASR